MFSFTTMSISITVDVTSPVNVTALARAQVPFYVTFQPNDTLVYKTTCTLLCMKRLGILRNH